ncbi:MAG TPA: antibiotic biosynthesis monooxygenase family protein [Candidatus Eisenbacteria bacterium]|nr:antibiotic biosynthesis monooxygenase family protein [Candidatus Eisenbacteria bacterium]
MSVAIIYRFRAREDKSAELLTLLQQGRDFSLTVDGCEEFDVYQGKDDPHQFVMMESWRSEQAHRAHFEKNARGSGWLERVEGLMTEPFEPPHESGFVRR